MHKLTCAALMLALPFAGPSAANAQGADGAASATPLAKSSKWVLNADTELCALASGFGDGADRVVLRMVQYAPHLPVEVQLSGKPLATGLVMTPLPMMLGADATVQESAWAGVTAAAPGADPLPLLVLTRGWRAVHGPALPDADAVAINGRMPAVQVSGETASITLRTPHGRWLRLETGRLEPGLAALQQCADTLPDGWGYARQSGAQAPRPAEAPGRWLSPRDFPRQDLRTGESALVHFRLDVDEGGKVTGCRISFAIGLGEFSQATCARLTERARFTPATDANGQPTRGYYVGTVRWGTAFR
ncbi:hypothetical protein GTZ99_00495 [Novosphingobium sp. FSY-8]|uniref:TonB C-terminal domain-containing protein n=1 Tax=Novosphingobium ovatum TaxID=1908523 RepID=A0ABW9X932_9SPHN|nr:energy transducer TonB [Novosphingobium ovatum]NBC35032.1 hypothetical protein [Novosphingobium ovatum]